MHLIKKSLLIRFLIFLTVLTPLFAAPPLKKSTENPKHERILKVAFYELEGFFEYDASHTPTGYGVDLLNKISQYTGIKFEYVNAPTWESTKALLLTGEADIRLPATKPIVSSTTLSYGNESIIETYQALLTLKTRDDLFYQDYEAFKKIKIAISQSYYVQNSVKTYLQNIGFSENQLILCSDYDESEEKVISGEADALISNIMDMDSNMKLLMRFNNINNYISMTIGNPILEVLDDTINQIKLDEPLFIAKLYQKWFPERIVIPFTIEENEYLSSIDSLTFAFRKNEGYLSRFENGQCYGIYVEIAKYICKHLGLDYNAVPLEDCLNGNAKTDVYSGFYYDYNYADECGYAISSQINTLNYYIIQKKENSINFESCKIAGIKNFLYTKRFLQKSYPNATLIFFDSYEDCLKAVVNGKADITILNNYIAEYYLGMYQYSGLFAHLTNDFSHLFCFATDENNQLLVSILSKEIEAITSDKMNELYIQGMETKPESSLLKAFMYRNPLLFALVIAGFIAMLLIMTLMYSFMKKSDKQNDMLIKANNSKNEFLSRMSHDMRTPLNAILGFAQIAQDESDKNIIQNSISKIRSSGQYLLGLINEILDTAKIESGKITLNLEITEGTTFLNGIADEFTEQALLKNINLIADITKANRPYVKIDKLRTRQIYSNLLNNALKFSAPGTTVIWSLESQKINETHMKFITTIKDQGCGMSKEFQKHMFEPFTQESRTKRNIIEGTGLGLSIVKNLIDLYNGKIEVESELNKGTTFTVTVIHEIPTQKQIEEYKHQQQLQTTITFNLKDVRILLCEDQKLNREIVMHFLSKQGVKIEYAENGQQGIEEFLKHEPFYYNAILMDIRMPIMDGLTAAKKNSSMQNRRRKNHSNHCTFCKRL